MKILSAFLLVALFLGPIDDSKAQEPFLGEIRMFAGNFAPRGWAFCNGQLLAISQNSALFSLLGTTYGGDGRTTFALPDLRGRAPIHQGSGPGLTPIRIGEKGGSETSMTYPISEINGNSAANALARPVGTSPVNKRDPYLGINYIIAMTGTYPSRN